MGLDEINNSRESISFSKLKDQERRRKIQTIENRIKNYEKRELHNHQRNKILPTWNRSMKMNTTTSCKRLNRPIPCYMVRTRGMEQQVFLEFRQLGIRRKAV